MSQSQSTFDPAYVPRHIAIIMDGNGRWARARKQSRLSGHRAGADAIRDVLYACRDFGVEYLTLYAFSTENWKRPENEVGGLMRLLEEYLKREVKALDKDNVRLRAIGDLETLPQRQQDILRRSIERLAKNTGPVLTLALSYGGRDELTRAMRSLARQVAAGTLAPEAITEETISGALDTAGIPDPDLMIRTAGELRISNFLLWQLSYAEMYVTPLCWPEFGREALAEAISAYQQRVRKFGEVVE